MNEPFAGERFSRHVTGTRFEDLPADAIFQAKSFILDTLGVGIAGSSAVGASELQRISARWGAGSEALIWGRRERVPAPTAAFLNGFQVHCQEFDCLHEPAVVHAMATLLPAAIAYAEREGGICGRDLIVAVAVGIDVAAGLGLAANEDLRFLSTRHRGRFRRNGRGGTVGGVRCRDVVQCLRDSIWPDQCTMQAHLEGSVVLPMQIGFNGRSSGMAASSNGSARTCWVVRRGG
jgi:aconitate decarboxylase